MQNFFRTLLILSAAGLGAIQSVHAGSVTVILNTDGFGGESSYSLVQNPGVGEIVIAEAAVGTLASNSAISVFSGDLTAGLYEFRVGDSFGDGIGTAFGGISPNYTITGAMGGPIFGDFDGSVTGAETVDDFSSLVVAFQVANTNVVPEPGTLVLFASGLGLLYVSGFKRHRRNQKIS